MFLHLLFACFLCLWELAAPIHATPLSKTQADAPYDVPQFLLRAAISFPPGFTKGKKQPVILVPGTGSTGSGTYTNSYLALLSNVAYADPVVLNVPGYMLGDIQTNAEYIAYAINYISSTYSTNVSIIGWSQGNLATQWALKYWPSTRSKVNDFIALSPDFHGTTEAYALCIVGLAIGCTPSIIQQTYASNFVTRLRMNGGDSAYVPTTTVYSSTDEVVQPQTGIGASGYINDALNVGVSNTNVQAACLGIGAGGIVTHEGILYNSLAHALAVDALTHPGPGSILRINPLVTCAETTAPGLSKADITTINGLIVQAAVYILAFPEKTIIEPLLRLYATY